MRRIGIMGGTFDPIHNGHLTLGEYAKKQFMLDEIWFMPNGNPPHKQENQQQRTHSSLREEMVSLAIQGYEGFRLEEYESNRAGISYTYQTMEHFNKIYPDVKFYFIIGADSLFAFDTWYHPERIVKTCVLLAAYRDDKNEMGIMEEQIAKLKSMFEGSDFRILFSPLVPVSSSDIRRRVKEGLPVTGMVPDTVEEYIYSHNLYT